MTRISIRRLRWFPAMTVTIQPRPKPRPAFDVTNIRRSDLTLAA